MHTSATLGEESWQGGLGGRRLSKVSAPAPLDWVLGSLLGLLIATSGLLLVEEAYHWFIIPASIAGAIIGCDTVSWVRGRVDLFDPLGIIGVVGLHFFLLSPILHVHWDYWTPYALGPIDWRPWLGWLAVGNVAGLLIYHASRRVSEALLPVKGKREWRLSYRRFYTIGLAVCLIAAILQVLVYAKFGGLVAMAESVFDISHSNAMDGMGWMLMISESFPIVGLMLVVERYKDRSWAKSWWFIVGILLLFVATRLVFGGLMGSRSKTVWSLFWAVGIIHYRLKPFSMRFVLGGLVLLVMFMNQYQVFKYGGLGAMYDSVERSRAEEMIAKYRSGKLESTLLADFSRSDIQALVLYRTSRGEIEPAYGQTYMAALALLVPSSLLPFKPVSKAEVGTEAQYGELSTDFGRRSSRVYGLVGEAVLNFGVIGFAFGFVVLGFVVAAVRKVGFSMSHRDARWLLYPLLVNLCIVILIGDADNLVFFTVKNGFVPVALVFLSRAK